MKKLIPVLLALTLFLVPLTGPVHAQDQTTPTSVPIADSAEAEETGFLPGTVPADSALMDAILLPINALVLSMAEHELVYQADSDAFVWNSLYYALSLSGQADDRAELTDHSLLLPSEAAQDFLRALFAQRTELPAIPEGMSEIISYEPSGDQYRLALGDVGLTETRLGELTDVGSGLYTVDGTLLSPADGSTLCSFRVTLTENDTMFGFSILDVTLF